MRTLIAGLCLAALSATPALAGPITVEGAWARPAPAGLPTSAAYFTIRNVGRAPDVLQAVSTPVARASVHESMAHGSMMSMQAAGPVTVPPGGVAVFKPGGMHLMLEALKGPLTPGARVPLTFTFKRAGTVRVEAAVRSTAP